MTDRELMQWALDALDGYARNCKCEGGGGTTDAAEALRARLAQPEPEPVAWKDAPSKIYLQVCEESNCDQPFDSHIEISWCQDKINDSDISYVRADIAPPQREWQGLTDEEMIKLGGLDKDSDYFGLWYDFARAIEAKLKEKNT